jgi:magnesium chelatase family protein
VVAQLVSPAVLGLETQTVQVEVDLRPGLPAFAVVGLPDTAVQEARERVRSGIVNQAFAVPARRIVANLAPADLRKAGPQYDLPIALAILAASGQLGPEAVRGVGAVGELALDGSLRPVAGALAMAEHAAARGWRRLVVPAANAAEAGLVGSVELLAADGLRHAVDLLEGRAEAAVPALDAPALLRAAEGDVGPDLAEVRGQAPARRALEVAAAGAHSALLLGPPGGGKTMLARRLPGILPPLGVEEAIAVTRVHSVAGLLDAGRPLVTRRPFRAPHHTISAAGLVGGGSHPLPGEATLAHHGVLFLDELSEFARPALEALRQPLEDGHVTIVRGQQVVAFPTRFMLVAASNPCPCGMGESACRCTAADLARHRRRLSGPLLDRIDVSVTVGRPSAAALRTQVAPRSAVVRARVIEARERQALRLGAFGIACNAQMTPRVMREVAHPTPSALRLLYELHDRHSLSARGHGRVLRVARTVADLEGSDRIGPDHVHIAAGLRLEQPALVEAA